jgi:hypothetical protein
MGDLGTQHSSAGVDSVADVFREESGRPRGRALQSRNARAVHGAASCDARAEINETYMRVQCLISVACLQ